MTSTMGTILLPKMQQRFILNISEEGTLILAPVTPVDDSQGIVLIIIKGGC